MRKTCFLIIIFLSFSSLWAQQLEPFGLEGKNVTALAISPSLRSITWPNHLFAAVDSQGVFMRDLRVDSGWVEMGLIGKKVTSLYVHHWYLSGISEKNELYAGIQPNKAAGDSVLMYKYTSEKGWIAYDSGMGRTNVASITALGSIFSFNLSGFGALFASGNGRIYQAMYPDYRWRETITIGEFVHSIQTNQRYFGDENIWAGGSIMANVTPWIAKSNDRGYSWEILSLGIGAAYSVLGIAINFQRSYIIYAFTQNGVLKTIDGGQNWQFTNLHNDYEYYNSICLDCNNPDHVYAGGMSGSKHLLLYESLDGGEHWKWAMENWNGDLPKGVISMVADSKRGGVIYLGTMGDGVWRYQSKEKSIQPNPLGFYPLAKGNKWEYEGTNENHSPPWETLRYTKEITGDTVIKGRRYWQNKISGETEHVEFVRLDTSTFMIYLFQPSDSTENVMYNLNAKIGEYSDTLWMVTTCSYWEERLVFGKKIVVKGFVAPAVYGYEGYELAYGFGQLTSWYAAHGPDHSFRLVGAVIDGVCYGSLTSVNDGNFLPKPGFFVLDQNYPNPFNPSTTIQYQLPKNGWVTIAIFNLHGQEVIRLVDGEQEAGNHVVRWDAGNQPSGIYLCRLVSSDLVESKKMLFLK